MDNEKNITFSRQSN